MSGAGGVVEGSVRIEQDRVFTGAQVVLIPAARRDRRDLYKTASVDQYGRFTIQGIAPGAYKVFAWEDAPSGAYLDPGFVRQYEEMGTSVDIEQGGSVQAQVYLIPAGP